MSNSYEERVNVWLSALVTHGNVPGKLQTRTAVVHSAVQFPGCSGNDKHCMSFPWGNRVLNEDCHHSHHCNSAEVKKWLDCHQVLSVLTEADCVRNHLALKTIVKVGEGCTCQHSHISPWKGHFAVESTRDSPLAGTASEQTETSSMKGVGGWCCCHHFIITFV